MLRHPHLAARGLVGTSPETGLPFIADPVRFIEDRWRPGSAGPAAPRLGADADEVARTWSPTRV